MFRHNGHIPEKCNKLEKLYHEYGHQLWHIAMQYVEDAHIAEDMVQQAFGKLIKNQEALGHVPDHRMRGFLAAIVAYQSIDYLRKEQCGPEEAYDEYIDTQYMDTEYADGTDADLALAKPMPLERLVLDETMDVIRNVLDSLPELCRITMELHVLYGLSARQIAGLLDIPEKQVAVRLDQGRKQIWKALGKGEI